VRGLAAPDDPVPLDAERAEDDTERQLQRLEHRSLLDVQLEVGGCVRELRPRIERGVEVDAESPDRLGQRRAVGVLQRTQVVLVGHRAGSGRGAEEGAAEAGALLVGPGDEPDGQRRLALLGDPAQHLGGGDDVERAVEPAAVGDRVEMPAEDERALVGAAQRPPLVAGRIEALLRARAIELPRHPLLRAAPGICPGDPLRPVLVARQLLQLAQLGDRSGGIEGHGRNLTAADPVW
jgi:hypothetical protein